MIFGVILGCAAATKLTGWFLPLPFLAWAVLYRSRQGFITLACRADHRRHRAVCPSAAVVERAGRRLDAVSGIQPEPRQDDPDQDSIPRNDLRHAQAVASLVQHARMDAVRDAGRLPGAGGRGSLGGSAKLAKQRSIGVLFAGHWLFLMILRAMPHTPGHDGVRLFLPAFGVLALLGGLGARSLARVVRAAGPRWRSRPH